MLRRTLSRVDVSSRSVFALVDEGSCFAGTLLELALAADRSYMLAPEDGSNAAPTLTLSEANLRLYPMANGLTRLATRFGGAAPALPIGESFDAARALEHGLVTFAPDELDWEDEVRLALEERRSLSPDALTGMEANLRFAGPETMETRVFGRLSAWQNWIFNRPNAVGEEGALKLFGSGRKPSFKWERI
jgi:benzoyl-CoA-dihydrodiol lyase